MTSRNIAEIKKLANCKNCGNEFASNKFCKSRIPKYCSKSCYAKSLIKLKVCPGCGTGFSSYPNTKYCNVDCYNKNRTSREGIKLSKEWRTALSEGRKKSLKCKGENLYNWKGGEKTKLIRLKQSYYKRKHSLKLPIDAKYLENVLLAQENKCFFCDEDLSNYKAIEHLTPVSKGGDNENYNLVYSCKSCNSKKRQLTLEQYAMKTKRFDWLDKFDYVYASAIY